MGSEVKEERERPPGVQVIHFLPCLPQQQSIFHYMQYNHWLYSNRRRLCLENLPGVYNNISCTQLLALASNVATSSPITTATPSSQMYCFSGTSIGINAATAGQKTIDYPQCDVVSTPKKFCCDLNLTPEETMSTSPRPIEAELAPIALDAPAGKRLTETEKEPRNITEKSSPERGEKGRKREREDETLQLKTPRQIQKRKKIRPKVVREGETKKSASKKPAVKETVSAAEAVTYPEESNSYVRPKRSTRRTLRFDSDDFVEDQEEDYCGLTFTSEGCISGKILPNPRIFDNIPKRRRQSRTGSTEKERICEQTSRDFLCSTLCLLNTEDVPSDSHISENNFTKFGRKRSTRVTRPRNFKSLKRVLQGFAPIKRGSKGHRPIQLTSIVSKMQPDVCRKKRSNRDSIASQLNAKVLHLQWRRRNSTDEQRFSIDDITKLFMELDINRESLSLQRNRETALILHHKMIQKQKQYDAMIPYGNGKKHQPKVNLDDETTRVWNLLMVSINSEGIDGLDEDKQKWWEDEREMFQGRANSFIARMRLVQGDRRFSHWKGSVVDSVVGVFLTQNVADHSSSSAFIDIAAEFPVKLNSNSNRGLCYEEWGSSLTFESVPSLDPGNAVTTSIIRNPARVIIHEVDDDEDTDAACSQETSITNESSVKLLGDSHNKNSFETICGSEAKEAVKSGDEEQVDETDIPTTSKKKGRSAKPKESIDWDSLRREAENGGDDGERDESTWDTVDWDALRISDVNKIAAIIRKRGMNNMLSKRIKAFLNRLVEEHGSIDLEWLRDIPPDQAKDFLLSIDGLGLKSVECVRLLSLHQIAFPVDTNVGRIAVRLGWVPLQPLPDELQMHLLELYPVLESVQKYLWPRLCKLDQKTLYELHYHMITFGKVFCTKVKPNCKACPMKAECRHYASARASAQLALPEPEEKAIVIGQDNKHNLKPIVVKFRRSLLLTGDKEQEMQKFQDCEPIIEEPTTPEPEPECELPDIEDYPWDTKVKTSMIIEGGPSNDPWENKDVIPTIMLHKEADASKDLVVLSGRASSIPTHKLKTMEKLRTEHHVYELPDSHPILEGFEKREREDSSPYLLAIWTPGETASSIQPPKRRCVFQESDTLCDEKTCFSCNNTREEMSQIVRGTILIPCRTAMRGRFPLNGTYFQTNEVFADHGSSVNPIDVPRVWIWNLPRRIAYFGSSVTAIFGGLSVEAIQYGFWRGYVCVRGFDRASRTSQTLVKRLHCPPGKHKEENDLN